MFPSKSRKHERKARPVNRGLSLRSLLYLCLFCAFFLSYFRDSNSYFTFSSEGPIRSSGSLGGGPHVDPAARSARSADRSRSPATRTADDFSASSSSILSSMPASSSPSTCSAWPTRDGLLHPAGPVEARHLPGPPTVQSAWLSSVPQSFIIEPSGPGGIPLSRRVTADIPCSAARPPRRRTPRFSAARCRRPTPSPPLRGN